MIDAAPSAAWYASADRLSAASAPISASTWVFRVAAALASSVPHNCSSFSTVLRVIEPRLSLRSFAYSGSASLRFSTVISPPMSRSELRRSLEQFAGIQGRVALAPVAGAQLVGLQSVQDPQHLVHVTPHGSCGRRDELDLVVRVDDEGDAVGDAAVVEDSGSQREFALDVGEHRERQLLEVFVLGAPLEVHEFTVHRDAEHLRVAILELVVQLAECGDLSRAHEGEVLRPEEHDPPLALVAVA